MKKTILYSPKTHTSVCIIQEKGGSEFTAFARCDPEDYKFETEFVGKFIAEAKASIKQEQHRLRILKEQFKSIKHLYFSAAQSQYFDTASYAARAMKKEYYRMKSLVDDTRDGIEEAKIALKMYVAKKHKFYRLTESHRTLKSIPAEDENS